MNARYKNLHKRGGERRSPKTTDDLASRRDLDYHLVAVVVDEVQEWFEFSSSKLNKRTCQEPFQAESPRSWSSRGQTDHMPQLQGARDPAPKW